ncbi:hypothetical protein SAMN05216486_10382 [bacterium JGI 053]|nr:hypothetical protein SAMN05216486_10382 [bacterium JGI 053]
MDAGHAAALTRRAVGVLCVASAVACAVPSADAVPPGERFPLTRGNAPPAPLEIVWVLRPDDYLTCQNAADGVRRLQRGYGRALPVTVLAIGPHPEWLREFLRRQRIDAEVTILAESEFRRRFQRQPAPWLYLLRGGRVFDVLPGLGSVYPAARWGPVIDSMRTLGMRRGPEGRGAGNHSRS